MNWLQLHQLAKDYLLPLFSGAELDGLPSKSTKRDKRVARLDPCTIAFKLNSADLQRLRLTRPQAFENISTGKVTEWKVVEAFVNVVRKMQVGLNNWYQADLRAAFPRRLVAKALGVSKEQEEALLTAIDQLSSWAGQEYEGKAIAAAFGFEPGEVSEGINLREFGALSFSPVLTNGFDTLIVSTPDGKLLRHKQLDAPSKAPSFAPYRMAALADWSKEKGRIALALNKAGEILIFRDGELCFTRRRGRWHFLTHKPVITQMGRLSKVSLKAKEDHLIRTAVYETCLDASFARTGACIGLVTKKHFPKWKEVADSSKDYLESSKSDKSRTLASLIEGKLFHHLDRRLRQELVAIDGATLINHDGRILAVGAILKIEGGSTAGGRLAAAKTLAKIGVGIKISQDGGIRGFAGSEESPKFRMMDD